MKPFVWIVPLLALASGHPYGHGHEVCPEPCQKEVTIPSECRKKEFIIGFDGKTRCPACDSNLCGPPIVVCPQLTCPNYANITVECRRPNFVIGSDKITRCRVCDSSVCGDPKDVCPQIKCPTKPQIAKKCREKQFLIGSDGITMCPSCDKNGCTAKTTEH